MAVKHTLNISTETTNATAAGTEEIYKPPLCFVRQQDRWGPTRVICAWPAAPRGREIYSYLWL